MAALFEKNLRAIFAVLLAVFLVPLSGCDAEDGEEAAPVIESSSAGSAESQALPRTGDSAPAPTRTPAQDHLFVRFFDVGQGDSALLSCGGQNLLIDGGGREASSKLYAVLQDAGITHLDYIIATHPDEDHCGGIAGALQNATCGTFFCSVDHHDTKTFNSVLKYLGSTPVTIPVLGEEFTLGTAKVRFVGPAQRTGDVNNGSLVCRVDHGSKSFLFTGDAEIASEGAMLGSGEDLDVDVLKVAHHGSDSSSSAAFLERVSPEYAVVSVGKNDYGHPDAVILDRLMASGTQVARTDQNGDIVFESDGEALTVSLTKGEVLHPPANEAETVPEVEAPAAVVEPAPAPPPPAVDQSTQADEMTVYVASSGKGKKYHSRATCSGMKGAVEITISSAEAQGYEPCKKCF